MANNIPTNDTTFFDLIEGYLNGENIDQTVLNRPLYQLSGNVGWLRKRLSDLVASLEGKENTIVRKSAFNKDFGSSPGTITEGNDPRLSNSRPPTPHDHDILALKTTVTNPGYLFFNGTSLVFSSGIEWNSVTGRPLLYPTSISNVQGLESALSNKAPLSHPHEISQINGLRAALDELIHRPTGIQTVEAGDVVGLQEAINASRRSSIKKTRFISTGESTFTIPTLGNLFKVTLNGIDLEDSSWTLTESTLTIPTLPGDILLVYVEVTSSTERFSRAVYTSLPGSISFTIAGGTQAWQVTVNGVDVDDFLQISNNVTLGSPLTGQDTVIIYGMKD